MSKIDRLLCAALVIIALLRALFLIVTAPQCWGVNYFSFLSTEVAGVLSIISLLAIVWGALGKDSEGDGTGKFNIFSIVSLIVIPLLAGLYFFSFPIPVPLLGDGGLFAGDLYRFVMTGQSVPLYREPLTMWINAHVCLWIYKWGWTTDLSAVYRITGALSGMLFILTALKIASNLRTSYNVKVFAFVLLSTCGGSLLFFGYVENYAPQYAMDLLYMALVFHMFRAKGSPVLPGVVLALSCLLHAQNMLLIPSFAVALGMRRAREREQGDQLGLSVYKFAAFLVPALLILYDFFQWKPVAPLESPGNPFIPFMTVGGMSYTLLSPMHLVDIVWEHLLLAPVAIALFGVLMSVARRRIQWTSPELLCTVIATLGLEAFVIGGNLRNGLSRDWDVVASLGPMLTLLAILVMEQVGQTIKSRSRVVTAAGIVATMGSVGWIAVNVNADAEVARYKALLDYHRPAVKETVTRYGYESLRKFYFQRKDWVNEIATDAMMVEVLPWHLDYQRMILLPEQVKATDTNIAATLERTTIRLLTTANDSMLRSETAGEDGRLRIAPHHAGNPATLGDLIVQATIRLYESYSRWTIEQSLAFSDAYIARHPKLPYGYELKGWLQFLGQDKEAAAENIRTAYSLDTLRPHPLVQLGSYYNFIGRHDTARIIARRALLLDGGYLDGARLLFGTMHTAPVTVADTADVRLIITGARRSLDEVNLRHESEEDIKQGKRILRDALGAWQTITGRDFE